MASSRSPVCSVESPASTGDVVVILRASKPVKDPYLQELLSAGYSCVHHLPVLCHEFLNSQQLQHSLSTPHNYSGLVLTSQTAVEACSPHSIGNWTDSPVFVVGTATAQAACRLGLTITGTPASNAQMLSQQIIDYYKLRPPDRPLLFPCADIRRDTLPVAMSEAGIPLEGVVCYNTLPHPDIDQELSKLASLVGAAVVWVVFFSPSGVNFALERVKSTLPSSQLKFAAIGGTTGSALELRGVTCSAVAKQPSPAALVKAMLDHSGVRE